MSGQDILFNVLGVIGSILLLFGFYRVNIGRWTSKSLWYELDNVIGAILIIIYQIHYHAFVTVVVNAIWAGVAFYGIVLFVRGVREHRRRKKKIQKGKGRK